MNKKFYRATMIGGVILFVIGIMKSQTLSFQLIGVVCSIVGGTGALFFGYKSNC